MTCTRRSVLAGTAATLALGASAHAADAPKFARPAIDVHHHFLPPFYKPLAKPWLDKFATGVSAVLAWTPEASLAAMAAVRLQRLDRIDCPDPAARRVFDSYLLLVPVLRSDRPKIAERRGLHPDGRNIFGAKDT